MATFTPGGKQLSVRFKRMTAEGPGAVWHFMKTKRDKQTFGNKS
jgi:hypothetical protein